MSNAIVNDYISNGWTLSVYAPLKGRWIFRATLEKEGADPLSPLVSGTSTSIEGAIESLAAFCKANKDVMESAGHL
jgi:hypothetical protein